MCALLYSTLFLTSWLWPYSTCGSMCSFLTLHNPILDCGHTLSLRQCGDCLICEFIILYLYNVVSVDCGLHFVFTPRILHVTWVSKPLSLTLPLLNFTQSRSTHLTATFATWVVCGGRHRTVMPWLSAYSRSSKVKWEEWPSTMRSLLQPFAIFSVCASKTVSIHCCPIIFDE